MDFNGGLSEAQPTPAERYQVWGPVGYQQYQRLTVMANNTSHHCLYRFDVVADLAFSIIGSGRSFRISTQSIVNRRVQPLGVSCTRNNNNVEGPASWRILH